MIDLIQFGWLALLTAAVMTGFVISARKRLLDHQRRRNQT